MKTQKVLIELVIITFFLMLMIPVRVLSESNPIVLESGFVRVGIFATGFEGPACLDFDDQGNLYVTNEGVPELGTYPGTTVSKVTPDGEVTTFATGFTGPSGLAFNSIEGNLYVSDNTNRVSKVTPDGHVEGFVTLPEGQPGNPNALAFIAFDGAWNIYVAAHGGAIYKVTHEGDIDIFVDSDDIPGGFYGPQAVVFDDEGNLYTSDHSSRVFKITPEGDATVFAIFPGGTQGGLAFDDYGNLYVSSESEHAIYKISPDGEVTPFVTGFDPLYNFPRGLIFDNEGSLYITEFATGIVWRVVSVRQAILDLIAKVKSLNIPRGLDNSLVKKLEATKRSLDIGNDTAAIRLLDAFMNLVQVQRGKKIDEDDADDLIEEAEEIQAAI